MPTHPNPGLNDWIDLLRRDHGTASAPGADRSFDSDRAAHARDADARIGKSPNAVTASYSPGTMSLSVLGGAKDDGLTVGRTVDGLLHVNGGAVPVKGGPATVANTLLIYVYGEGGADTLVLDERNGALPAADLFGGAGNDRLSGGSADDLLFGQGDHDQLFGLGGNDQLFGGSGNDTLAGGPGSDQLLGEAGDDRLIWNPGDGNDLFEGGDGVDTAEVHGGGGGEIFTVTANGTRVRLDRLDPEPFNLDIGSTETLQLDAGDGDDQFLATGNLAALIGISVDGGAGNDTLLGSNGADTLAGGDGNDFVDGNQGNDFVQLGNGEDRFQWDPGDGSDRVDGQDGVDQLLFNGSAASETVVLTTQAGALRLTRDVGAITMDLTAMEVLRLRTFGGNDTVVAEGLAGSGATQLEIDLGSLTGGADGQADTVNLAATTGADAVEIGGDATATTVAGLPVAVQALSADALDTLLLRGLDGDDRISAAGWMGGWGLVLDGGAGNDRLVGSAGADRLFGGDGDDQVQGRQGADLAQLGSGNDRFDWNPGDGNDVVDGQDGIDTLVFKGAAVAEAIDLAANGARLVMARNVGAVTLDLGGIERIELAAGAGADFLSASDLSGTGLAELRLDLAATPGGAGGDAAADTLVLRAGALADAVVVAGSGDSLGVTGLAARVDVLRSDGELDRLMIDGGDGADTLDASALAAGVVSLELRGGPGTDTLVGSAGADTLAGGFANDVVHGGGGDDRVVWNPGDGSDTIDGGSGADTLQFSGANIGEALYLSASGAVATLTRDVATISLTLADIETLRLATLGGADSVTLDDQDGTAIETVAVELAAANGSGDAQADTVSLRGTAGDDSLLVAGDGESVLAEGLSATVQILHGEAAFDRLIVTTGAGHDVVDAAGLGVTALRLFVDAGDGDDVITGGAGPDVLAGGDGDDILIGGDGDDFLDGGAGNDVLIGGAGNDTFLNGEVMIESFVAGAGTEDRIDLRALPGLGFEQLMQRARAQGADAVLDLGNGEHITLVGVNLAQLDADDFVFGS